MKNDLSQSGQQIICQYLTHEIRLYIDLLNRAANLSDEDVREALEKVRSNCPAVVAALGSDGGESEAAKP